MKYSHGSSQSQTHLDKANIQHTLMDIFISISTVLAFISKPENIKQKSIASNAFCTLMYLLDGTFFHWVVSNNKNKLNNYACLTMEYEKA